ncbi:sigma-54-dependent Fis family transcriptional regulator [Acidocella aquatica]|uniref:Sigma-54-dependent Fis family transcriptional regulator n=2 Tax=Acidocella aquatica TaxID=1922313 RepID=A0ABQ6AE87_9PROT|nr:sigma-54-dependent Fis family transcriptional regulator [Acidocella aquatica]
MPELARVDGPHMGQTQLRAATDRRATLIAQARPVIDYIYSQIRDSGCVMLLSDENGYLLESAGDTDFCTRAAQVALQPGACWAENTRGTNAVGTALIEGRPIVVNGTEHYLRHNNFLACAAAPLVEPGGRMLGVIDISCDARRYHPHTFGLVRAAAQMIENRIFELTFVNQMKLRFHLSSACLGSVMEGTLALSEDGRIIGANRTGFHLLGLTPADIGERDIASALGIGLRELLDLNRHAQGRPVALHRRGSESMFIMVEHVRPPQFLPGNLPAVAPKTTTEDALGALDTGDARVHTAIAQARRVLGRKVPILLQGETGAGKDVFARAIHASSGRAQKPFVAVNCAALPESLIESELFGHAPGSFTGARREGALGRIREAHGGTLFLDEIGDMPLHMQTRLLRVLEDGYVTPIGGKPVPVDFLLISATHCDLKARIGTQEFRADLYYRLNGLTIALPPARERTDLPELIERILAREALERGDGTQLQLAPELAGAFARYPWPGNLRQLAGMLRTACLMLDTGDTELRLEHLSEEAQAELNRKHTAPPPTARPVTLRARADALIGNAVAETGGNVAAAARKLGISRNTLYRRLAAGAIPPEATKTLQPRKLNS